MKSKFLRFGVFAALTLGATYSAQAALSWTAPLKVYQVVLHSQSSLGNKNWLVLDSTTTLGTCPLFQGRAVFTVEDNARGEAIIAMAQAALMARKNVIVNADDAVPRVGGFCEARALTLTQ